VRRAVVQGHAWVAMLGRDSEKPTS